MLTSWLLQTPNPQPTIYLQVQNSPPVDDPATVEWANGAISLIQLSFTGSFPIYTLIILVLIIKRIIRARI